MSPALPAPPEPLLEVDDIQGNILAGFQKDHQLLVGLRLRDIAAARRWLRRLVPEVATTTEVHHFNQLFQRLKTRRGRDPEGMAATWMNLAVSAGGLEKLTSPGEVAQLPDDAFRLGLLARSAAVLHDPAIGEPGGPDTWKVGGPDRVPDVLLLLASEVRSQLDAAVDRLLPRQDDGAAADLPEVIYNEHGDVRPDLPGHEHFGFKDGISQPGVRGLLSHNPDVVLEPRHLAPSDPRSQVDARPGMELIWPGHFVLGYPAQSRIDGTPLPPPPLPLPWLKNGSLLVFRRLLQDVHGFRTFLRERAADLAARPGFAGLTADHLGALFVGRWPSGAPLVRSPGIDVPRLGADEWAANHFNYVAPMPPALLRPGEVHPPDRFPAAQPDAAGLLCPFAAHVRKANPRDQDTEIGDAFDTATRRILRRGIPFGPPLPADAAGPDGVPRGLLFLCYQASIEQQFEVLMGNWINAPSTPRPGGHDPILGQAAGGADRFIVLPPLPGQAGAAVTVPLPPRWVTPGGGGYFFAPSLTALNDFATRP